MAKSQESFNKKEKEKKRAQKKLDKEAKKEERKANSDKGKGLESMLAYVDEHGNISASPPDPRKKLEIAAEDIQVSVQKRKDIEPEDLIRTGIISHFNQSKGYGFIRDLQTQDSIFVHINQMQDQLSEGQKVTFETEKGQKGLVAVNVKKA